MVEITTRTLTTDERAQLESFVAWRPSRRSQVSWSVGCWLVSCVSGYCVGHVLGILSELCLFLPYEVVLRWTVALFAISGATCGWFWGREQWRSRHGHELAKAVQTLQRGTVSVWRVTAARAALLPTAPTAADLWVFDVDQRQLLVLGGQALAAATQATIWPVDAFELEVVSEGEWQLLRPTGQPLRQVMRLDNQTTCNSAARACAALAQRSARCLQLIPGELDTCVADLAAWCREARSL